jgi:hypothetical protein
VFSAVGSLALLGMATTASAESIPASKAAVALDELINISQTATGPGSSNNDTGWVDILSTQIKTANQKDLLFDVSLQCGLVTDTTVKSTNGTTSAATARGVIAVRVLVDDEAALPDGGIDAAKQEAEGIVYCDRIQTLAAKFSGLNCTADLETGEVTCLDPEELQLILRTLNANAFNFVATDVGSGVHNITVQARAQAGVNFNDDTSGAAMAGAEAFIGAGAVHVEEVRLVKGADVVVDLQ